MLDFCYFVNVSPWFQHPDTLFTLFYLQISVLLQSLTCTMDSDSGFCATWFKSNFVMSHGPIAIAILAWQNSIVFHSLDKMTSYFIHIMPVIN